MVSDSLCIDELLSVCQAVERTLAGYLNRPLSLDRDHSVLGADKASAYIIVKAVPSEHTLLRDTHEPPLIKDE